jgi:hypothetical protein
MKTGRLPDRALVKLVVVEVMMSDQRNPRGSEIASGHNGDTSNAKGNEI